MVTRSQDELRSVETGVTKSGNGAHVYLPKEWRGELVRVKRLGQYWPELLNPIKRRSEDGDEDIEVSIKFENEKFDDELEVSGVVESIDMNETKEQMSARLIVRNAESYDSAPDKYRVSISREVGTSGWDESEYTLFRTIEDIDPVDEVIQADEDGLWEPIGTVSGIAITQTA